MKYLPLLLLTASLSASAQMNICPTYTIPEVRINKINFLVTPNMEVEDLNLKKLPIKKKITPAGVTEYDKNGNIIKEETQHGSFRKTIKCTYTNGVLTERQYLYFPDKEKTEAANRESLRTGEAEIAGNGMGSVAYAEPNKTESLYTATLNNKNQVTSFRTQEFTFKGNDKKLTSEQQTDITYLNGKISSVKSANGTELYTYKNGLLAKRDRKIKDNMIEKSISEEFLYDSNKNLIGIQYKEEATRNGEIMGKSSGMRDPISYDSKNRMVKYGNGQSFTQYTYDSAGNMSSMTDYSGGIDLGKKQFEYEKNLLTKVSEIKGGVKSSQDQYTYKNGLLTEMKSYSGSTLNAKMVFEYNDKNHLTKASLLYPKNASGTEFTPSSETEYIYEGKSVTVKNQGKETLRYELY
ncbi:hypothetical protein V2E39_11390 [Chryseobacterium arthrosphaerae]|uniref:Sugar-binding protein n=2 Tax=Chryseobacterium arthrosphaerae TaxID=651561 RepID=A0ABU7QZJ1_9FLAO|nr:hypothetical protein [Chryseobacterium arthrosphaerae]